jgi:hypothetical protein
MDMPTSPDNWAKLRSKLRINYPKLPESDFQYTDGEEHKMLRLIGYKLRLTKQEMEEVIAQL